MYSTLSRCLRITRFERWTTYWRRRMSPTERRVFTKHSSRIPSRIFGSGSTPLGRVMKLQVLSYRVVTRMETYATERSHQHQTTGKAITADASLFRLNFPVFPTTSTVAVGLLNTGKDV